MIEHTYQVLEYHHLLEILSRYASCPLGRSECLSITPSNDIQWIERELNLVSETRLLFKIRGLLSFGDLMDLTGLLSRARIKGACLEPEDFLTVLQLAESGQSVRRFLGTDRSLYPGLSSVMDDMPDLASLISELKGVMLPNGDIKDNATPLLAKIRRQRRGQRSRLEKKLNDIRMAKGLGRGGDDHLVTVRDGRYVISVRSDQKALMGGIVHDYSRSRSTCFVEPMEAIEDNNRCAELVLEERGEEHRILVRLTGIVRDMTPEITRAQDLIARLDTLFARARYGEDFSCVSPEISDTGHVRLKEAKNPILLALSRSRQKEDAHEPVAVDILLERNRSVLIVTGPNRGGKTVTLKTLGLMSLMAQAGIHIPAAEGSCLPVFDHFLADIGDDQDIESGLSTFSAHAGNLKHIVEWAGPKTLAIIDEPGMGTDPNEGAALTMAVLDELSSRGAFVALATHLNRLKAYGLLNPRVFNAAVEFDPMSNRPTFRLRYGSPGISHALDTARELGIPAHILDRARGYLDQNEVHLNRLIEKMHHLTVQGETAKREAEAAKQAHDTAAEELKHQAARLDVEKRAAIDRYRAEAEAAIGSAREELRQAINHLKTKGRSVQDKTARRVGSVGRDLIVRFESTRDRPDSSSSPEWEEGQRVFHTTLKQHGVVQSVDSSGDRVYLMLGNVKVSADPGDLEIPAGSDMGPAHPSWPSHPWTTGEKTSLSRSSEGLSSGELNVIGCHVDEAIPLIDRAMDQALMEGKLSLTIVHGHGTGRLRGAIREHLQAMPFVKTVASADPRLGGDAVTIAELG